MQKTLAQRLQDVADWDGATAARVASAIVGALTEQLSARDRALFVARLPAGVPRPSPSEGAPCESLALFYERVRTLAGLPIGRAIEASQVVCAALAELLDAPTRVWLAARLPSALAALFAQRELPPHPPEAPHAQRRRPTLAEARPGSAHPLSEAHLERAHRDSVARSENPHAESKLSSSPGPTQSREHETLAEADPRPARRLSDGKP